MLIDRRLIGDIPNAKATRMNQFIFNHDAENAAGNRLAFHMFAEDHVYFRKGARQFGQFE